MRDGGRRALPAPRPPTPPRPTTPLPTSTASSVSSSASSLPFFPAAAADDDDDIGAEAIFAFRSKAGAVALPALLARPHEGPKGPREGLGRRSLRALQLPLLLPLVLLLGVAALLPGTSAAVPRDLSQLDKPDSPLLVSGAVGQSAALPCRAKSGPGEDPSLLLWYRHPSPDGAPIYRVDARGRPLSEARLWSSPSWFGARAHLVVDGDAVRLAVHPLRGEDDGLYRCRADFKDAPTRNTLVNLSVAVPPSELYVSRWPRRSPRVTVDTLPPFMEGEEMRLTCTAVGGRPRPSVVWLLSGVVVSESNAEEDNVVVSELVVPALGRQHLDARLVCRASNGPLAPPSERHLRLDVYLRPLSVSIVGRERVLRAGTSYAVQCRCVGSRPPADISWWLVAAQGPSRQLTRQDEQAEQVVSEDVSELTLIPTADDNGKHLECRAKNPMFGDHEVRDRWLLAVQYPPRVTVRLGRALNASGIKVGDDVYLECSVDANPRAGPVSWRHNGVELAGGVAGVVVVGEGVLVLQRVRRQAAGEYACSAANSLGRGVSPGLQLSVLFAPECARRGLLVKGALLRETVELACEVDALPAPHWFRWTFNDSDALPGAAKQTTATTMAAARVALTPVAAADYGTFACWADNGVGHQEEPCLFQVVNAGPPLPPANCSMVRVLGPADRPAELRVAGDDAAVAAAPFADFGAPQDDADADADGEGRLRVDCRAPPPSGLPEHYELLVLEEPRRALRRNVSLPAGAPPVWELPWSPEAGVAYSARVHAVNARGRSEATTLSGGPLRGLDPLPDPSTQYGELGGPLLTGLVVAASGLLLVSGAALAVVLQACRPRAEPEAAVVAPSGVAEVTTTTTLPEKQAVAADEDDGDVQALTALLAPRRRGLIGEVADDDHRLEAADLLRQAEMQSLRPSLHPRASPVQESVC